MTVITPAEAKSKINDGWFDVWLAFEGLAIKPEIIRSALEGLAQRLGEDIKCKLYSKEFLDPVKVEKPLKGIEEAWSEVANIKVVARGFPELVQLIIEYGPSSVEVISPSKKEVPIAEIQDVLNNVAGMMHRYAAAGIGGGIVVRGNE